MSFIHIRGYKEEDKRSFDGSQIEIFKFNGLFLATDLREFFLRWSTCGLFENRINLQNSIEYFVLKYSRITDIDLYWQIDEISSFSVSIVCI